jgi:hypothetical protein
MVWFPIVLAVAMILSRLPLTLVVMVSAVAMIAAVPVVPAIAMPTAVSVSWVGINRRSKNNKRYNRRKCSFESATLKHDNCSLRLR